MISVTPTGVLLFSPFVTGTVRPFHLHLRQVSPRSPSPTSTRVSCVRVVYTRCVYTTHGRWRDEVFDKGHDILLSRVFFGVTCYSGQVYTSITVYLGPTITLHTEVSR